MKKVVKLLPIALFVLLFGASLAGNALLYTKYQDLKKNSPAEVTKNLTEKVGKLIDLPTDETPSIATVDDKEKLKDQPFFASAEKGDKLLIYQAGKKAIIYRESTNKVINVGPIAIQQNAKVTVKIIGKAADRDAVEKILLEKFPNAGLTITKADAKGSYNETVVVDVNKNQTDAATQLVGALKNAKVGDLPATEDKATDMIFVIVAGPQQ